MLVYAFLYHQLTEIKFVSTAVPYNTYLVSVNVAMVGKNLEGVEAETTNYFKVIQSDFIVAKLKDDSFQQVTFGNMVSCTQHSTESILI